MQLWPHGKQQQQHFEPDREITWYRYLDKTRRNKKERLCGAARKEERERKRSKRNNMELILLGKKREGGERDKDKSEAKTSYILYL